MARNITKANMVLRVREATDQVNSTFVSDAEIARYLDMSYGEMWERVHMAGALVGLSIATHSGDGSTSSFTPNSGAGWLTTLWVGIRQGSTYWKLPRLAPEKYLDALNGPVGQPWGYIIEELTLDVVPAAATGMTIYHAHIVQHASIISKADGDSVNCITPTGERIIVLGACIEVRKKKEDSYAALMSERENLFEKFESHLMQLYGADNRTSKMVGPLGVEESRTTDPADWWWYRGGL